MAENHFITRYWITKMSEKKDKLNGIEELKNLFHQNLQDVFFDFFKNYYVKQEEISKLAFESEARKSKNFFKIIEMKKEDSGIIYGKIIFSDFEEVLNSLIVKKEETIIPAEMKFIPKRTFFFMFKFIKIREIMGKNMEIGILLLHKRGTHSIKSVFNTMISNVNTEIKLNLNSITFDEEFEELEKAEIKEVTVIERNTLSDLPEEDISELGIKKSQICRNFKIKSGRTGVTKYVKKICEMMSKKNKAPFYLDVENNLIDITLESKTGKKILRYTNDNGKQKVASIILDGKKIYKNQELDWNAIRKEFEKEMKECEEKMKVKNW